MFELTDDEIAEAKHGQPWYEFSHAVARAQLAKVARMLSGLALERVRLTEAPIDIAYQALALEGARQQLEAVRKALEE